MRVSGAMTIRLAVVKSASGSAAKSVVTRSSTSVNSPLFRRGATESISAEKSVDDAEDRRAQFVQVAGVSLGGRLSDALLDPRQHESDHSGVEFGSFAAL